MLVTALVSAACGGGDDSSSATSDPPDSTDGRADDIGASGPTGEPQQGGTLRYVANADVNTYDPSTSQWGSGGWTVAVAIFDTLMEIDENGDLQPYLAESFEPNEDHTKWTITPLQGITFHNGEVLTAELIATNIERYAASPLVATALIDRESVEVVGNTVVITVSRPWVKFPLIFTDRPGIVVAQEMIDDPDGGRNPIGTGPFVFNSWVIDDKLTVAANPDYWNGPVYLDAIEFLVVVEADAREAGMKTGEFDVAPYLSASGIVGLREDDHDLQVFIDDGEVEEIFFLINLDRPPFDDIRVRQALVLAHDRQAGIDVTGEGLYEPASGMFAPNSAWYVDSDFPETDRERARELVDEWEAETGQQLSVKLGSTQESGTIRNLQFIQGEWEEVGIDVEIVPQERAEYINNTLLGDYDVNVWQFYSAGHPDGEYVYLHSKNAPAEGLAPNFGRIRDDVIDAALDEARGESDPERQKELYGEIQQAMTDGYYHIWSYHDLNALAAQPDVGNLTVWTFADGEPGRPMRNGVATKLTNVWLDQG